MDIDFHHQPAYTMARAHLDSTESITVEAGGLISHTEDVEMETKSSSGGLLSSVKQSVLSDEEVFRNTFTATANGQTVSFGHTQPGDLTQLELDHQTVYVQSGSYVANGPGVETDSVSGGLDSLLGGKGLFFLKAEGAGPLVLGSYGGIFVEELEDGESLVVDAGHSVAWDDSVEFSTHRVGGLKRTLLSGEGFVMTFTGPGRVFMQTRDYDAFLGDVAYQVDSGD